MFFNQSMFFKHSFLSIFTNLIVQMEKFLQLVQLSLIYLNDKTCVVHYIKLHVYKIQTYF